MSLRGYQQEALDALDKYWADGLLRLGIALPTGTGKTHIMAALATDRHSRAPGSVLVLVHRDTLVNQTEARMRKQAAPFGNLTVGVVKAERNVVNAHIVVASVHTLRNSARLEQLRPPSLIIVDEAHVSMSDTYAKVFSRFPNAQVAGFTATWTRSDSRKLGDFWQKIVYQRGIRWAIREGHLVMPKALAVGAPDLEGVRTRGGDYVDSDLGAAVSVEEMRTNVVRGYLEHGGSRSSVLFAPTQGAAEYFGDALRAAGVATTGIYATTGPRHRRVAFDAYKRGTVKVLTTCTALAEGWDAPWCSCALMVRPTRSIGLYVQQVGRILRPWPGKRDALVLDFTGSAQGLSLSLEAVLSQTMPAHEPDLMIAEDGLDPEEIAEQIEADHDDQLMFTVGRGTKPVDLFAGTGARWLMTYHGVPFIATTTALYFLCQVEDGWNVGTCSIDSLFGGRWLLEGVTSDEALQYASIVAVEDDASIAAYDAPWRRQKQVTSAQRNYAMSQGIVLDEGETKSSLSDKFTIRRASSTLATIGVQQ